MKIIIGILFLFIESSVGQSQEEKVAVKDLAEQSMIALSNYLTPCDSSPYYGRCLNTTNLPNDSQVKIIVWNPLGNIIEELSTPNPRSKIWYLPRIEKKFMIFHDFGESSCSNRIRDMIRSIYKRKPKSLVTSLDYSSMVIYLSSIILGT